MIKIDFNFIEIRNFYLQTVSIVTQKNSSKTKFLRIKSVWKFKLCYCSSSKHHTHIFLYSSSASFWQLLRKFTTCLQQGFKTSYFSITKFCICWFFQKLFSNFQEIFSAFLDFIWSLSGRFESNCHPLNVKSQIYIHFSID